METSPLAKRLTGRFVAGETLDEELAVCRQLANENILSTLDHLGENVTSLEEAAASRDAYLEALERIHAAGLPCTVSIKLTQFGLDLSEQACLENVRRLADKARATGNRVEVDMESSAYTDRTLSVATRVAEECGCIRTVIQAYLYRSAADIGHLNERRIPVRLCKGAYDEPSSVAFANSTDVRTNYRKLMKVLLDRGTYPAIATHDELLLMEALDYARTRGLGPDQLEFQMLYGINRELQKRIVGLGYRLRLYVPYGTAWYPYFMRRLGERPANVLFVLRNLFR